MTMCRMRAAQGADLGTGTKGFVHDLLDGQRAAAALRAAAEATIDLTGRARRARDAHRVSHIMVAEDVAGTNDHGIRTAC